MKRVLFFGTFDPLHPGHRHAFVQARALGEYLIVVVARDSAIAQEKQRQSHRDENHRLAQVASCTGVDEVMLGDSDVNSYHLLTTTLFDILALGYDQAPSDEQATALLQKHGLEHVRIVRLSAHEPMKYKSSLLRS